MTDDIVTRLRKKATDERSGYGMHIDKYDDFLDQAADEIERLREWKELCYSMRNSRWWILRHKHLVDFDYYHRRDREKR